MNKKKLDSVDLNKTPYTIEMADLYAHNTWNNTVSNINRCTRRIAYQLHVLYYPTRRSVDNKVYT